MDKAPVKLLAGFSSMAGLVLLLLVTFNLTQNPQSTTSQADTSNAKVDLISDSSVFKDNKTIFIDFSKVSCCKVLSHEYMQEGVVFDNEQELGWATYQANGFVNHISGPEQEPGAPTGSSGTRISFSDPVRSVGFQVQSGTPFSVDDFRPAKSLTLKAYDKDNNLLYFKVTDTCLGEQSSCRPRFVGLSSNRKVIKFLEVIINESYSWSIDDLRYEI